MMIYLSERSIIVILLAALVLRLLGVCEGLPAVYYSTEQFLAKYALKMAAAKTLDPGFYIYPSLYQYVLVVLYGIYYLAGLAGGVFNDSYDFAVSFLLNPSGLFLSGRFLNIGISIFSIWLMYKFILKISTKRAAVFGALLMTLSYYLIVFSRFAVQESLMLLFALLAMKKLHACTTHNKGSDFIQAGIFAGLAIAAKYNAGFLVAGLLMAVFLQEKSKGRNLTLVMGSLLAAFLAANPYWLIAPSNYWYGFVVVVDQMSTGVSEARGFPYLWEIRTILMHELVIGALFLSTVVMAVIRRNKFDLVALAIVLPTFLYVGSWDKKGIDYLLVCWPAFVFWAAQDLDVFIEKYKRFKRVIILIVFLPSFIWVSYDAILRMIPDTRSEASDWLREKVNSQTRVYYDKGGYDLNLTDLTRYTDRAAHAGFLHPEIKNRLSTQFAQVNEVQFIASTEIVSDLLSDNVRFNYTAEQKSVRWRTFDEIIADSVHFAIINHRYRNMYISAAGAVNDLAERRNDMSQFYKELQRSGNKLKTYRPSFWQRGPAIDIFDLSRINIK